MQIISNCKSTPERRQQTLSKQRKPSVVEIKQRRLGYMEKYNRVEYGL